MAFENLSNSEISTLIDEWIRNERNRYILKCRVIDGLTFVDLATRFNLSERQVKSIVHEGLSVLKEHV